MKKCTLSTLMGWLVVAALVSGCGKRSLPTAELEQAREHVETGLRAWQKGDKPESLEKLSPPLRFHDDDWQKGLRLASWEVTSLNGSAGDDLPRCEVLLSLVDRSGKTTSRRVVYQVEKKETIVVLRDPYF